MADSLKGTWFSFKAAFTGSQEALAALNNQSQSQTFGSTDNIINVTIANGAEFLGNRSIQPSNIIKAKVGDVIVFTNEDWQSHFFRSPPSTDSGGPQVAVDTNFHF